MPETQSLYKTQGDLGLKSILALAHHAIKYSSTIDNTATWVSKSKRRMTIC